MTEKMFPSKSSQFLLKGDSIHSTESDRPHSNCNISPLTIKPFKMETNNRTGPDKNDKIKSRRSVPTPTPVQTNPIFQQQNFGKPILSKHIRQRRGSFLYKQDSASNIGDVISPKLAPTKNVEKLSSNEEFIITPFAQILAKLRLVIRNT